MMATGFLSLPKLCLAPAVAALLLLPNANAQTFVKHPASETGIDLVNPITVDHPLSRVYYSSSACGAVVTADFTGNGVPEIFLTSGPETNRLYRQTDGNFKYEDITEKAGLADVENHWSVGAAAADIDNDGDLDLYVCLYDEPNRLWINETPPGADIPKFTEQAAKWGLDIKDGSIQPGFADYDRDGKLDMYLLTFRLYRKGGRPEGGIEVRTNDDGSQGIVVGENSRYYKYKGIVDGKPTFDEAPRADYLFRNTGSQFVDVTKAAGVGYRRSYGNSVTWWDWNRDGFPDIFVGNDFSDPDFFYLNQGDGTFQEVLGSIAPSSAWTSMGAAVIDVDNNGWTELLMGDMSATSHYKNKLFMGEMGSGIDRILAETGPRQLPRNAFYLNAGGPRLLDIANMSGVAATDWTWAIQADDFDQDGWQDLFFANGMVRQFTHADITGLSSGSQLDGSNMFDFYKEHPELREQNLAYRNRGDLTFEDVSQAWGLDQISMSFGAATADLDRDGDLDLIVTNLEEPPFIFENTVARGNSIRIALAGKTSNRFGIGARVEIRVNGEYQVRELHTIGGFLSVDEPIVHFGIGDATAAERARILWPSGAVQVVENLAAGKIHTITEPDDVPEKPVHFTLVDRPTPLFTEAVAPVGEMEEAFDDFEAQPLLPKAHSQLGPGASFVDFTGDGVSDLILSGSKFKANRVFRRAGSDGGTGLQIFPHSSAVLSADKISETMTTLLFDADGDGDADLFLANGSVEAPKGDASYQDQLYLNDGTGKFNFAPGAIPQLTDSSFAAVAADYDRDGDLDLAVSSRLIPGEYPKPATSRLLRNDQGKFTDVTADLAPGLIATGLGTGMLWSDVNNDGWLDLLAAHEWGPVKSFLNDKNGKLIDNTAASGIADVLGWWQGIDGRDLNGDGHIDYVVTNFGPNTIYKASKKKPELIYFGEMLGCGKNNIIEAKFEGTICYPRRGYS